MSDFDMQTLYANEQHDFACVALGISSAYDDSGETLLDAVRALLRDRNEWKEEADLREKKADLWERECDVLRDNALADLRQADTDSIRALHERNEAREQRDKLADQLESERKLADQLAAIVQRSRDGHGGMLTDPECFCEDCKYLRVLDPVLDRWKEARK